MTKFLTILKKILPQLLPLFFILIIIFAICIVYIFNNFCYNLCSKKIENKNKQYIKVHDIQVKKLDDVVGKVAIAYAV